MRSVLLRATMGSSSPWTISAGARSRSAAGSLAARTLSSGLMSAPGGNTPAAVSDGEAAPESPRAVARRVAEQVSGLGYTLICGPELEFYVCQQAADGSWQRYADDPGNVYVVGRKGDPEGLLLHMLRQLRDAGLGVTAANHEFSPGQFEINLGHSELADAAVRC
jgi:glutamine synthetase